MLSLTVAIIGRPNVGKSTLFNRLVGRRAALVHDQPGVTRDRREGEGRLFDLEFRLFDTAGLEEAEEKSLEGRMRAQTERAVADADLSLFLIDARAGVTPYDRHFADWLRKSGHKVVLVANKCEGRDAEAGLAEAHSLGFGEPIALSAEHGLGLDELYDALREVCVPEEEGDEEPEAWDGEEASMESEESEPKALQLAIVGRPNVGKSTLVNRLIGEERLLTGAEAGITRDAIAVDWTYKGQAIRLIDTAGIRRRPKVDESVEKLSVSDSFRALRFAQVVVLLVDAEAPLEKQDLTIARTTIEEGRALVLAVNKWDLCEDRDAAIRAVRDRLTRSLPQTKGLPVVPISALYDRRLDKLLDAVLAVYETWNKRIPTARLNQWLESVTASHPPPAPGGRRIRLKYMTQAKSRPPTFAVFCTKPSDLPDSYLRYLENTLREDFKLPGIPIRIQLRKGDNPYAKKKRRR